MVVVVDGGAVSLLVTRLSVPDQRLLGLVLVLLTGHVQLMYLCGMPSNGPQAHVVDHLAVGEGQRHQIRTEDTDLMDGGVGDDLARQTREPAGAYHIPLALPITCTKSQNHNDNLLVDGYLLGQIDPLFESAVIGVIHECHEEGS